MAQALHIEQSHDSPVLIRQFHHRFVQFFFQLGEAGLFFRVARGTCIDKLRAILQIELGVIHAQIMPVLVPLDEVNGEIVANPIKPGEELGIEAEGMDAP